MKTISRWSIWSQYYTARLRLLRCYTHDEEDHGSIVALECVCFNIFVDQFYVRNFSSDDNHIVMQHCEYIKGLYDVTHNRTDLGFRVILRSRIQKSSTTLEAYNIIHLQQ